MGGDRWAGVLFVFPISCLKDIKILIDWKLGIFFAIMC